MIVVILGADGYIGWPLARRFSTEGHTVVAVDNYFRRRAAWELDCEPLLPSPSLTGRAKRWAQTSGKTIHVRIGDVTDRRFLARLLRRHEPDVVVHLAEQRATPYAMLDFPHAAFTLSNNVLSTLSAAWTILEICLQCHLVKLGSLGEYGTPNVEIPEGWFDYTAGGRTDRLLFPRHALDIYHLSKVMDTDLLEMFVRTHGLTVTDLMQGIVYGLDESGTPTTLMTNFQYDDVFGTVLNRFIVQSVAGHPLTVYGKGGQTRGVISLKDAVQCIYLAAVRPPECATLRVFNQFTETFAINQLAQKVKAEGGQLGMHVEINHTQNPRCEAESHYYAPRFKKLTRLGFRPHLLDDKALSRMLRFVVQHRQRIDDRKIVRHTLAAPRTRVRMPPLPSGEAIGLECATSTPVVGAGCADSANLQGPPSTQGATTKPNGVAFRPYS